MLRNKDWWKNIRAETERKGDDEAFPIVTNSLKALNGSYYGIWSPAGLGSNRSAVVQLRVLWSGVLGVGRETWLQQEELELRGLGRAKEWRMGLRVNAKTINPTLAWPWVPIKFIYIFTLCPPFKTPMFRHFKTPWQTHHSWNQALAITDERWNQFIPLWPETPLPLLFKNCSKDTLIVCFYGVSIDII